MKKVSQVGSGVSGPKWGKAPRPLQGFKLARFSMKNVEKDQRNVGKAKPRKGLG